MKIGVKENNYPWVRINFGVLEHVYNCSEYYRYWNMAAVSKIVGFLQIFCNL